MYKKSLETYWMYHIFFLTDKSDQQMGPWKVHPVQVRVAMKGFSTFLRVPQLETHYQLQIGFIPRRPYYLDKVGLCLYISLLVNLFNIFPLAGHNALISPFSILVQIAWPLFPIMMKVFRFVLLGLLETTRQLQDYSCSLKNLMC